jgi:hypothetical protein
MQRDLGILHDAFASLHPGVYRYQTPAEFEARFAAARATCSVPVEEERFYIILSKLGAALRCGHTHINPLNLPDTLAARLLPKTVVPFLFKVVDEHHFIITHNLTQDPDLQPGTEIESINGITAKVMLDSLLTVSRGDGRNAQGKQLANVNIEPDGCGQHQFFDIYFSFFFGDSKDFLVEMTPYKGKTVVRTVDGLAPATRGAAYKTKYGPLPEDENTDVYKMLDAETAYFAAGTFAFWNSDFPIKKYIDSVFKDIIAKPSIKKLVIDIRANEGGDDELAFQILSYLAPKPLGCDDQSRLTYRFLTVPDSLKPYLSTWDPSFAKPKDPAKYKLNEIGLYEALQQEPCVPVKPQPKRFAGKVAMLIGPKNSSATFEMALQCKMAKLGHLVGENSGGTQQGLNGGKMFFLRLPATHLEMDLPIQHYYHPGKPDEGVRPDVHAEATQASIAQGTDPVLEEALAHLKKR